MHGSTKPGRIQLATETRDFLRRLDDRSHAHLMVASCPVCRAYRSLSVTICLSDEDETKVDEIRIHCRNGCRLQKIVAAAFRRNPPKARRRRAGSQEGDAHGEHPGDTGQAVGRQRSEPERELCGEMPGTQ